MLIQEYLIGGAGNLGYALVPRAGQGEALYRALASGDAMQCLTGWGLVAALVEISIILQTARI